MISLIVTLEVNPDKLQEFIGFVCEAAAASRSQEPACRRFEVTQLTDPSNIFTLAELYDDMAALEAHRLTPHFLLFKQRLAEGQLILKRTASLGSVISA